MGGEEHESHLIKGRGKLRVDELEEQVPKWFDLAATGHVDTAGAERSHQTKVGAREGKHGKEEMFLGPVGDTEELHQL